MRSNIEPDPSVLKRWGIIAVVRGRIRNRVNSSRFGGDSGLGGSGRMQRPFAVGPVQKGSSAMLVATPLPGPGLVGRGPCSVE